MNNYSYTNCYFCRWNFYHFLLLFRLVVRIEWFSNYHNVSTSSVVIIYRQILKYRIKHIRYKITFEHVNGEGENSITRCSFFECGSDSATNYHHHKNLVGLSKARDTAHSNPVRINIWAKQRRGHWVTQCPKCNKCFFKLEWNLFWYLCLKAS